MTHTGHHHCQNCGANFETQDALDGHAKDCHRQEPLSGTSANKGAAGQVKERERKGREFTRSYRE